MILWIRIINITSKFINTTSRNYLNIFTRIILELNKEMK